MPITAKNWPGHSVERQEIAMEQASKMQELLEANTRLTEQVNQLTQEFTNA
jgi:hypothetical protein